MTENTIYAKIDKLRERINNDGDKEEILYEIQLLVNDIFKLPIFDEYTELVKLYQIHYDEHLYGGFVNVENKR